MKEINTYEEYVLNELDEKKRRSKRHVLTVNPP